MREIFVDNFAGGGGASTGIEIAIGRNVDIAINHDPDAIAMHKANHPNTKHYCEDVWEVDPVEACNGRSVALAWFSPDCKHFSRAKGGKPVDKKIRGLAWVAIRWALLVRPRVIMLENVPEIQTWGPLGEDSKPIKERSGETFSGFILALTSGILKSHPAFAEMCNALENLGEDVFRSSGRFGISKVKVLTAFTPAEAAAFIDENDIDGMTVKELKSKVEELTSHGEQLSMEMAQSKSTSESEIKKLQDDIRKLKAQNAQLETENDELQHRPIEVAVREPSQAEIAEYSKTAVEQAIAEREKKHAEEIKKIKVAARKEAEERVKSVNSQLAEEISKIRQHSAELEKQLKLSASPEITRFSFYFDALQSNIKNLVDSLSKINDVETAAKLKANMCKFADMLKGMFM